MTVHPIIGFVTHLSPDQIRGFAVSSVDINPLTVDLYYNGDKIASQPATLPAKLLTERNIPDNHGFHFDLKSLGHFHWRDKLEVRVGNTILNFAPHLALIRMKNKYDLPSRQALFFFMHIQKTAGTSFRMMLYKQFHQEYIWPNKSDIAKNGGSYPRIATYREIPMDKKVRGQLVMGHYPMWMLRFMPVRPRVLTFLRDPRQQMLSLAVHKKTQFSELKHKSLSEIIKDDIMDNPQSYFFLPAHVPTDAIDDEQFDLMKKELLSCEFVGTRERFDEGVDYLEQKYNWSFGKKLRKNIGKREEVVGEVLQIIDKKTKWDQKLYKLAVEKFDNLIQGI